jgi:putrescine aminotransferase
MAQDEFRGRVDTISRYVNAPYISFLDRLGLTIEFTRAEGARIYDRDGRMFIDCVAGYGNLNLGHNHPRIVNAVVEELLSLRPYNLPFLSQAQSRLAERLAEVTPGDLECSLFVNSGSEAVDSGLKLARLATGRPHVVAARGAWHGFTFGAMSVSEPAMCRSFMPLLGDVTQVPYGDAEAARNAINDQTGALIIEPIQAESGAIVPPVGYLPALMEICAEKKVVLIFDEVKTGIGKTGRVFACEHDGAVPDVILAGKALGGGVVPIGTVTARRNLWGKVGLSFPMSSSSGGGNAPACAAAVAALDTLSDEGLCAQAEHKGARILAAMEDLVREFPGVVSGSSGRGLLIALHTPNLKMASDLVRGCLARGVLVMAAFCDRTRVLIEPPLCIEETLVDSLIESLRGAVSELARAL